MSRKDNIEELLLAYVAGTLDPARRDEIERLIATDEEVRRLHGVIAALHRESKESNDLRSAAKALIARFVRDLRGSRAGRDKHRGLLTFDSGLLPLPAGIRPATIDSRRLKYTAGDHELEVSMYPGSPGTYEIIGQVSGFQTGEALEVRLERSRRVLTATSNQFQVFHFVRVPAGEYTLLVSGPGDETYSFVLEV